MPDKPHDEGELMVKDAPNPMRPIAARKRNRAAMKTSRTGTKGVFSIAGGRYGAQIYIGTYRTLAEASAAYERVARLINAQAPQS